MKRIFPILLGLLFVALVLPPSFGQNKPSPESAPAPSSEATADENYHLVVFLPSYRFVSTSGFTGRVAEYDSLNQSVGGELSLTLIDAGRRNSWRYRANFLSRDEYEMNSQLRLGSFLTLGIDSRSLIRHLDNVPFGTNLSPDDVLRTDTIPESLLFGVKRTQNVVNARLKVPDKPVTFFVKGGWQSRRGWTQMQYYDMGADAECGSCHSAAQFRSVNYTNRNIGGGIELKVGHVTAVYEHNFRSFKDRLQNPFDPYGSTLSLPGDELPPGVPDTLQGNYAHNVLPSHRTFSDTLRIRATLTNEATFNGSFTNGHTRNLFSGNPEKFLNGDATLNWNPRRSLRTTLEFHQQNLINSFTPDYPLFGNPSYHRWWAGVRLDYRVVSWADVDVHYRRSNVTRSNSALWPQFYSPNNMGLEFTPADAYVARLAPATFSNTVGVAVKVHPGERWSVRSGYEWVGTHAPGYLTDPQTAHRAFVTGSVTPVSWLTFTNDFSVLLQSSFPAIQRQNRLYLNTSYLTLKPVSDWSLTAGYAYYQNNLRTDLTYGTDPFYQESLVPFKSLSQSYSVSSNYLWKKKLGWVVDMSHVASHSDFRPNLTDPLIPVCGPPGAEQICSVSVAMATAFSRVSVPQIAVGLTLDYRWQAGMNGGIRFQYGSYKDVVHPELTGHLRAFGLFVGRTW